MMTCALASVARLAGLVKGSLACCGGGGSAVVPSAAGITGMGGTFLATFLVSTLLEVLAWELLGVFRSPASCCAFATRRRADADVAWRRCVAGVSLLEERLGMAGVKRKPEFRNY